MKTMTRAGSFVLMLILVYNIEGQLDLIPSDTIFRYVNASVTFHCYHRSDSLRYSVWLINGMYISNSNLSQYSTVFTIPGSSNLIINVLIPEFNNTIINCNASSSTGIMESSQDTDIKLQGKLPKVNDLRITVNGSYLILIWNPPFAIIDDITYIVAERCTNSTILSNYVTRQLYHNIGLIASFESDCTDYSYDITPENVVGLGQMATISIISEDIIMVNYSRQKRNQDQNFDLLVELTTVICTTRIQWRVFNLNLSYMALNEFTLNAVSQDYYKYLFNLNLPSGFHFHLNLNFNNSRDYYQQSITISTHNIRDVELKVIESGLLNVKPIYYDDSNVNKSFLLLLLCKNEECIEINYEHSRFILIKEKECNVSYLSGYYLVYAFDVNNKGAISPSSISTAYPAYNQRNNLTYNGVTNSQTSTSINCSFVYDSGQICSRCNIIYSSENNSLHQVVLLPRTYNNLLTDRISISDPAELNVKTCLSNKSDDYYAIIILVSKDNTACLYPIARRIISSISHSGIFDTTQSHNDVLVITNSGSITPPDVTEGNTEMPGTTRESNIPLMWIIIGVAIFLVALIVIVSGCLIIVFCCKGKIGYYRKGYLAQDEVQHCGSLNDCVSEEKFDLTTL